MKITIEEVGSQGEEELILRCREINDEILAFIKKWKAARSGLFGIKDGEIHRLALTDIYYFEVVDSRSFFYCHNVVYETKLKLYEFEALCQGTSFFRASKSMILNADKIDSLLPSPWGRFEVRLQNQERVMVSRQYVGILKKQIGL